MFLHGALANDGDHNIVDSVEYIVSRVWAGPDGGDRVGVVMCQDGQIFAAREVQKADARPGGYITAGGHGGILGRIADAFPPTNTTLTFVPARRHTASSSINLHQLPSTTSGVARSNGRITQVPVTVREESGDLLPTAVPRVSLVKDAQQFGGDAAMDGPTRDPAGEVELQARIEHNLQHAPLAGFVGEGMAPLRHSHRGRRRRLAPGRLFGDAGGQGWSGQQRRLHRRGSAVPVGNNLTASKARLLLMACLMKFGAPPPTVDANQPTEAEFAATREHLAA